MIARVSAVVVVVLLGAAPAHACSFVERSLADRFTRADVVFVGRVASTELGDDLRAVLAMFEVHEVYKGRVAGTVRVHTASTADACGVSFVPGERYAVFADRNGAALRTDASGVELEDGGLGSAYRLIMRYQAGASSVVVSATSRAGPIAAACLLIALTAAGHLVRRRTKWRPRHAM